MSLILFYIINPFFLSQSILLIRSVSREIEMDKKLLEESQKNLDFEQRLRKTYAEIAGKEIKSKYFR